MKKRVIMLIIIIVTLISFMIIINTNKKNNKPNKNMILGKDEVVDGLKITDVSIENKSNSAKIHLVVTNIGKDDRNISQFIIHISDKNGLNIINIIGFVGETLKRNKSRVIDNEIKSNLAKTAKIQYEIKTN